VLQKISIGVRRGLLGVVLFLGGVAFVEQLAPELETQTQDEQALAEFSYALKTDRAVIGSGPALGVGPFVSVLNDSFGVPALPSQASTGAWIFSLQAVFPPTSPTAFHLSHLIVAPAPFSRLAEA